MRSTILPLGQIASLAFAAAQAAALEQPRPRVVVVDPPPEPRPSYEQLGYTKRYMELNAEKAAKAEAKRQRRRERNLRHCAPQVSSCHGTPDPMRNDA